MQEEILREFHAALQAEANTKIKKAFDLFMRADESLRGIMLYNTGFSGDLTSKTLRDHFDMLDLMDGLDDVIGNMEYNLG